MSDMDLNAFAQEVHANAVAKGFWDTDRPWGETIALIHAELSEALEEHRASRPRIWHTPPDHWATRIWGLPPQSGVKPEGWGIELADAAIRILDLMAHEAWAVPLDGGPVVDIDEGFPTLIAEAHKITSETYVFEADSTRAMWLDMLLCLLLEAIGDDWPKILRAKHAYNLTRERLHGKAY